MTEEERWGRVVDAHDGIGVLEQLLSGRTREDGPDPDSVACLLRMIQGKLDEALEIEGC